jgi:hypothetical protein
MGKGYRKLHKASGEPDAVKVARPVREEEVDGFQNEGVGSLLHSLGSGFDSLAAHQSIVEGSSNRSSCRLPLGVFCSIRHCCAFE